MTTPSTRPAGAMTVAMSAPTARPVGPRVLRLGVLGTTSPVAEQVVTTRRPVSVGCTERATVLVAAEDFPGHAVLFVPRGGGWALRCVPGLGGRIARDGVTHPLADLARAATERDGDAALLPLDDTTRGKLTLGSATVLFQFVPPPPPRPQAQLPTALRRSALRDADWRYNASLAVFLSLAAGALGYVEYGYDPIVTGESAQHYLVRSPVRLDPDSTPAPEAPPAMPAPADTAEAAAAPSPTHRAPSPTHHGPRPNTTAPGPRVPDDRAVARAVANAQRAAEAAARGTEASFGALTATGPGARTARDQLANGTLMAGTERDLAHTQGVTDRAPAIARDTRGQRPGVGDPGRPGLLRGTPAIGTQDVGPEVGPRTRVVMMPSHDPPPADPTCRADAGGVARALRNNLGGIRSCYERAVRNAPTLSGRLSLRFTVGESGRARAVSADGLTSEVSACVESAVQRIVFPVPACGAESYEFPINFDTGSR